MKDLYKHSLGLKKERILHAFYPFLICERLFHIFYFLLINSEAGSKKRNRKGLCHASSPGTLFHLLSVGEALSEVELSIFALLMQIIGRF